MYDSIRDGVVPEDKVTAVEFRTSALKRRVAKLEGLSYHTRAAMSRSANSVFSPALPTGFVRQTTRAKLPRSIHR